MTSALPLHLTTEQAEAARAATDRARAFLARASFPLGVALVEHLWHNAPANEVITALASYQNDDGGFGRGLEVDIAAPESNPFATRLAMQALLALREQPSGELVDRLQQWLVTNQSPDGDWHFSDATRAGALAPWFAGWTFPSLNPACCLAGLANRLGIATPAMLERVAHLFASKASIEDAGRADFYAVLPYVEYAAGVEFPERDAYLDTLAATIGRMDASGVYDDALHYLQHLLGGGPDLVRRVDPGHVVAKVDALLDEQQADGGWPTPYDPAWRPWATAEACMFLARLRPA